MFAPESPQVTVGYQSDDFEWIEVLNNGSTPIDFEATNFVLDDAAGSKLTTANVNEGTLPVGGVGVLFNAEKISSEQMQAMWGEGNYIPVERWPGLNNSGPETIGIWESYGSYSGESANPRSFGNAVAAVTYHTQVNQGWPTTSEGNSIWLSDLSGNPNDGANWIRADDGDALSENASPIFEPAIDHPGDDIGSPGYVPGVVVTLPGDYNGDNAVDAADYVQWRTGDGSPNGYNIWRANFGRTAASGNGLMEVRVPEPATKLVTLVMGLAWLALRPCRVSKLKTGPRGGPAIG
jgi:hypothetical protein